MPKTSPQLFHCRFLPPMRPTNAACHAFEVFATRACVEHDDALVAPDRLPRTSFSTAKSPAPPSGAALMPSSVARNRMHARHVRVVHGPAAVPAARVHVARAPGSRPPPSARAGRRRPSSRLPHPCVRRAIRRAHDRRAAVGLHRDHARPLRLAGIQPIASSSSNAFHMPTRPVPPPVG